MSEFAIQDGLKVLAQHAESADARREWPAPSWNVLRDAGVLRWSIPREFGGDGRDGVELLAGYEQLASACMTTCFLLSQREAACRRLRDGANAELRAELLPKLARGEFFATVGLSQLTTSRQYGRPALVARDEPGGFRLDGFMPWVTGAPHADYFIIGAVLEESNQQMLAVLPRTQRGVSVGEPLDLMALQGSLTGEVRCDGVFLDRRWLLAGPASSVLSTTRGGAGGLETSCLALGLAGAAIGYLADEATRRADLQITAERLGRTRDALRQEMYDLLKGQGTAEAATTLRARANSLVLRATQAALTAGKGAGFVRGHPAQRWARQALFFLVWSCPRPAAEAMLATFCVDG
jgi:alkylation response protein AidB-like acyl-CoA dehydrogenase